MTDRLLLASSSPRRRELLALLGVRFTVGAPDIDERAAPYPALAKAQLLAVPGVVTLAADTEIDLDGERLGKPTDAADARAMLARLAGRAHEVVTAVAVIGAAGAQLTFAVRSRVTMRVRDDAAIGAYVAGGEPLDKAGAYAIQGGGAALIARQDGCLANVVGLPLCHVQAALRRAGVVTPERAEVVCPRHFSFRCLVSQAARAQGRVLRDRAVYDTSGAGGPTPRSG